MWETSEWVSLRVGHVRVKRREGEKEM